MHENRMRVFVGDILMKCESVGPRISE